MASDPKREKVEAQVSAARADGDFDNLPCRGKPLQLEDLDHLPLEQRFEALLMRSTGEVPVQVTLVREIRACRDAFRQSTSDADRERYRRILEEKQAQLQAVLKQNREGA